MKKRLDQLLVEMAAAQTRSQAKLLIQNGKILVKGKVVHKAGEMAHVDEVTILERQKYVGRGADKIAGAAEKFLIDFKDKVIADVGASTGGFTEFALLAGAKKVYAIDVGHDQLDASLVRNSKVINLEGVNIKNPLKLAELVDIAVVDLSYISLKSVLHNISGLCHDHGTMVTLVKPQFEAGRGRIGKNGIVKEESVRWDILQDLWSWCFLNKFFIKDACASPLLGKTGNKEYFFYFDKKLVAHQIDQEHLKKII